MKKVIAAIFATLISSAAFAEIGALPSDYHVDGSFGASTMERGSGFNVHNDLGGEG